MIHCELYFHLYKLIVFIIITTTFNTPSLFRYTLKLIFSTNPFHHELLGPHPMRSD